MGLALTQDVAAVKGIGERKAALYRKMGIFTIGQLVMHLPRDYIDLTRVVELDDCEPGIPLLVRAVVTSKSREQRIRKGLSLFKVGAVSGGVDLALTFYNTRFAVDALKIGEEALLYGVVTGTLLRREMSAPAIIPPAFAGGWQPIYPGVAGLSSRVIGRDVAQTLVGLREPLPEPLPDWLRERLGLPDLDRAVRDLHRPPDLARRDAARRRVSFGELLIFSAAMLTLRGVRERMAAPAMERRPLEPLWDGLPFSLTQDQRAAVDDVVADLCAGHAMNRLIQGDVGSGKTMVAASAAYFAHRNGCQTALMAPTELLAEQHAATLRATLAPHGMAVELLTGSMGVKARREAAARLERGEAHLAVGTHALLSEQTRFHRLGLVVTDEQHRFGVSQRAALTAKGEAVHTLVMSATPIPRTLSLILYGDLDVSIIAELPPGRRPVETYRIDSARRARAFGFIRDRLDEGRQAYVVCPLVEGGEQAVEGLIPAAQYAEQLAEGAFSGYRVGLLHGKMKQRDKEDMMGRFTRGEIQLLVATTVVEVGVDVPNAAVMLVENAERFGLSQLHQLRGRVGRGAHQSYCILVSDARGALTLERLKALCATNDGFRIAEEDLRLRGPGDFLGVRQHGLPNAELALDAALLTEAREAAAALLADDPILEKPEHAGIRREVESLLRRVGTLPN